MKLTISDELKELLPDFSIIAYTFSISNTLDKSATVDKMIDKLNEEFVNKYDQTLITKIPIINETRNAYKKLGKDPSHTRPACEALLRRVNQGKGLYRLGDAIDVGNVLSVYTGRSVCVVDSDKIQGDILIRRGVNESFEGINRGIINADKLICYTDELGIFGSPTSDTNRTSVKENTKNLLVMVLCFGTDLLKESEDKLLELYKQINTKNFERIL